MMGGGQTHYNLSPVQRKNIHSGTLSLESDNVDLPLFRDSNLRELQKHRKGESFQLIDFEASVKF